MSLLTMPDMALGGVINTFNEEMDVREPVAPHSAFQVYEGVTAVASRVRLGLPVRQDLPSGFFS